MPDYHAILGVEKTASPNEIKKAWKQLARRHHPDKNHDSNQAKRKMEQINEAYDRLVKGDKWDKEINSGAQPMRASYSTSYLYNYGEGWVVGSHESFSSYHDSAGFDPFADKRELCWKGKCFRMPAFELSPPELLDYSGRVSYYSAHKIKGYMELLLVVLFLASGLLYLLLDFVRKAKRKR